MLLIVWDDIGSTTLDVGRPGDRQFILGFYAAERSEAATFRWSSASAALALPARALPGVIDIRGTLSRSQPALRLSGDAARLVLPNKQSRPPAWRRFRILWPARPELLPWSLLRLRAPNSEPHLGRPHNLALLVDTVTISPLEARGRPPLLLIATLAACPLVLAWLLRLAGLSPLLRKQAGLLVGVAAALAYGWQPGWLHQLYLPALLTIIALAGLLGWARAAGYVTRRRSAAVLLIMLLALVLRLRATALLPVHYDEDDYLRAAQIYAGHLQKQDLAAIIAERENYEHPPLTKIVYGAVLWLTQYPPSYSQPVYGMNRAPEIAALARPLRLTSAAIGALTAALVAAASPGAGLLVALNPWHTKYTSLALLEAPAGLFAALALLTLRRSRANSGRWWWGAALALGLAAASKYLYAVAGLAAVLWSLRREPRSWPRLLAWCALALLTFYMANPALWPDPVGRLYASLGFSANYTGSVSVQAASYPWYQPLLWLISAVPESSGVLFASYGWVVVLAAALMLSPAWRRERLVLLWFAAGLGFLLLWPTRWDHYIVSLVIPLSLLATQLFGRWRRLLPAEWKLASFVQRILQQNFR